MAELMRLRRHHRTQAVAAAASFALFLAPPAAQSRSLPEYGTATVASVDGPGMLTIRAGRRTIPVRLVPIDLPRPGECGATETTAALRGFVARAPRKLTYDLVDSVDGRLIRDTDGRYAVALQYSVRRRLRDLAADLVRADWGRWGVPAALDGGPAPDPNLLDFASAGAGADNESSPRPRRGLWARCGGRAHLPVSAPVPETVAPTWQVDEQGITTSIGAITLSPSLVPGGGLTVRQLAEVAPVETTWVSSSSCHAWLPSLQLRAFAYVGEGGRCDAFVESLRSIGPEGAKLARGGALGSAASELRALFPNLVSSTASSSWPLAGPDRRQWAWQTEVSVDETKRAVSLATYLSPTIPQ